MTTDEDRRDYIRINDEIKMKYELVMQEHLAQEATVILSRVEQPTRSLNMLDTQITMQLEVLKAKDRDTYKFFKLLNKKINLISNAIACENDTNNEEGLIDQEVSISASGIGFISKEALSLGGTLKLSIQIKTSPFKIISLGEIVSCVKVERGYQLHVEYSHIHTDDQEVLIQHVLRTQSKQIRNKREQELMDALNA